MDKTSFSNLVVNLYRYFRYDKRPSTEQINMWQEDLEYIPNSASNEILRLLKENDSVPRNLPKAIKGAYARCKKDPSARRYDKYDDPDYPVMFLWTAFGIIEKKGHEEFIRYCRSVKMPAMDIKRVESKYKCAFNVEDLYNVVGTHTNPGERQREF